MNAVLKTEAIALESAVPLEVTDPTQDLILVPLSQLLPRRALELGSKGAVDGPRPD